MTDAVQNLPTDLRPGDLVRARDERWKVVDAERFARCTVFRLGGLDRGNRATACALVHPFDRIDRLDRVGRPCRVSRQRWWRAFRALIATTPPHDGLAVAAFAGIDLLPYQLEPALAVVGGMASRLLLADEVGLGKTIQAGLVAAELVARGDAERVLVLVPAGLRDQWVAELTSRFGLPAAAIDAVELRRRTASLPRGVNPWSLARVVVASIDFVKQPEVRQNLERRLWDLLVVDEAHAVAGARERREAVARLAVRARRLVLLTATPHAGDDEAFQSLCRLGELGGDRIVMFRRTRHDAGVAVERRIRFLRVQPTNAERQMLGALDRYIHLVWRRIAAGRPRRDPDAARVRLAMIVLKKRALSSAASLARSLARRLAWLETGDPGPAAQLGLPLAAPEDDEADEADAEPGDELAAPGLADRALERRWLIRLHDAAMAAACGESKRARLERLLDRIPEPVIVFTEYRDTLAGIASSLARLNPVCLHGGLSDADRRAALERFRRGDARLLLATDAAAEGLNLQPRCRWVINFELPWNPMRVEQRIGRVDRIGQIGRVRVTHLISGHTAEATVLGRLVWRLDRARRAIGSIADPLGSIPVALLADAMIAGDGRTLRSWPMAAPGRYSQRSREATTAAGGLVQRTDLCDISRRECERQASLRRLIAPSSHAPSHLAPSHLAPRTSHPARCGPAWVHEVLTALDCRSPWVTTARRFGPLVRWLGEVTALPGFRPSETAPQPRRPGAVLIYRATIEDGAGRSVETVLVPVVVPAPPPGAAIDLIEPRARALAERAVQRRLARVIDERGRLFARTAARERAVAGALTPGVPAQPGLFDRESWRSGNPDLALAHGPDIDGDSWLARLGHRSSLSTRERPALALALLLGSPQRGTVWGVTSIGHVASPPGHLATFGVILPAEQR
jgi:ERCC4-related helicase